jgi:hypothetical protein
MGVLRYSEGELRDLLGRAVRIRWPDETVLMVTPCHAESQPVNVLGVVDESDPNPPAGWGSSHAVLAATRSRLIYQERTTHAILLKAMATALFALAVAVLFFGSGLVGFAGIGVAGLSLWAIAKLIELLTIGGTNIEFHQVQKVDRMAQRIDGAVGSGLLYRLRVPDPSDFGMIASLVNGYGQAAA